jgi:tyrosinase
MTPQLTRRAVLPLAGALPLVLRGADVHPRPALSKHNVDTLVEAFDRLRAKPPSEVPWHPLTLAAMHADFCGGVRSGPKDIHNNWHFLPWHRAIVRLFEMSLQSVMPEHPDFRLPYWNWEKTRGEIPEKLKSHPGFDTGTTVKRSVDPVSLGTNTAPERLLEMMCPELSSGAGCSDFPGFLGGPASAGTASTARPHQGVHSSVGGFMRKPKTAALDPLFYLHHANVDRVWEVWARRNGGHGNVGYAADWCAAGEHLRFHDSATGSHMDFGSNQKLVDTRTLGYAYEDQRLPADLEGPTFCVELSPFLGMSVRITGLRAPRSLTRLNVQKVLDELLRRRKAGEHLPTIYVAWQNVKLPKSDDGFYTFWLRQGLLAPLPLGDWFVFRDREDPQPASVLFRLDPARYHYLPSALSLHCRPGKGASIQGLSPVPFDSVSGIMRLSLTDL